MNPLDEIQFPDVPFELRPRLVLVVRAGSEAHGTRVPPEDPTSIDDRDVVGLVMPPARVLVGLGRWEGADSIKGCWDVVLHALPKFVRMLRQQNPNALGVLWTREEDVLFESPVGRALREHRLAFRARKRAFDAFCGYARSQLKDMHRHGDAKRRYMGEKRAAMVRAHGFDSKNAAHLLRLLRMGHEYLVTGKLSVWRGDRDADYLMRVKKGLVPLAEILAESERLFELCAMAAESSALPEEPDDAVIERLLIDDIAQALNLQRAEWLRRLKP